MAGFLAPPAGWANARLPSQGCVLSDKVVAVPPIACRNVRRESRVGACEGLIIAPFLAAGRPVVPVLPVLNVAS
jgi:hypothetical protein